MIVINVKYLNGGKLPRIQRILNDDYTDMRVYESMKELLQVYGAVDEIENDPIWDSVCQREFGSEDHFFTFPWARKGSEVVTVKDGYFYTSGEGILLRNLVSAGEKNTSRYGLSRDYFVAYLAYGTDLTEGNIVVFVKSCPENFAAIHEALFDGAEKVTDPMNLSSESVEKTKYVYETSKSFKLDKKDGAK